MARPVVLKLGGELLEHAADVRWAAAAITDLASRTPLIVVHGGGREIDRALEASGIPKVQVDGVRVTDAATLEVVVSVLAGGINTRLVAAVRAAGARPVGLTGADAGVVSVRRAAPFTATGGATVRPGLVGAPVSNGRPQLLTDLLARDYVPILACIGASRKGQLLNVNADTLAAHVAADTGARRLIIAGVTPGVLDASGCTIRRLRARDATRLIRQGTANRGMVAKLRACRLALRGGVKDVLIVDGRDMNLGRLGAGLTPSTSASVTQVIA